MYSFLHALNSFHETIKFTADIRETSANFLDVKVTKDTHGNITTDLYTKHTDSHLYLHYSSFHPKHQKRSLPYSQALRLRRICSTNELFRKASHNLFNDFILRGYPIQLDKSAIQKAASLNREDLFQPTTTDAQNKNIIPFIITHNPYNPPISQILSKYRVYRINIPATSDNTNNIKQRRRISRLNPYIAITAEEALDLH